MRISKVSWALCATIVAAGAAQADSIDRQFGLLDDAPRFMLYVHKQIGAPRHKNFGPSFGFAIERSMPIWSAGDGSVLQASTARIFDLSIAPFADNAIFLNGLQLTGNSLRGLGYEGSYDEGGSFEGSDSWKGNPLLWIGVGVAGAAGISCLTKNWPCKSSSSSGEAPYRVPGE